MVGGGVTTTQYRNHDDLQSDMALLHPNKFYDYNESYTDWLSPHKLGCFARNRVIYTQLIHANLTIARTQ